MANRYVPIAAIATLMTAAATVAQPQTTTDTSTAAGTTATQTTPSASTPATNPGSTTTGTATDTSTGTQGMHGGFRGTPSGSTTSGTTTTTDTSTSGTTDTASASGTTSTTDTSSGATADAATSATAEGTATASAAGASSLQGQDAEFLRKAVEGDRLEIASAQAALDSAQRTDTKNAARMIVEDHQRSSQKLQELASRKGWTLPSVTGTADSDQAVTSTSDSGSFDDRFMADQIRMHREAISLYRAQASSGSDPDLRQFARDQLPHLEHHLEMLQGSNTQK
jgi:putative membrane protein